MEDEIKKLKMMLDRELEWVQTGEIGTKKKEVEYLDLKESEITEILSDDQAVTIIAKNFGFQPDKIKIIYEVSVYEVNKYHSLREKETFIRNPVYASSDWNYIRFDCSGYSYEMIDGELVRYD